MSEKQGCSTVVVVMIAVLALIVGGLAGAAALYFVVGVEDASTPVPGEPATVAVAPTGVDGGDKYALLYPIEESLRIEGALPAESVTATVKDRRYNLRKCYQDALAKDASLKGEMSLQFTVSGDTGKVIAALERHTDIGNEDLKKCILKEVRTWELAKTKKGESVVKFDILMVPISSAGAAEP